VLNRSSAQLKLAQASDSNPWIKAAILRSAGANAMSLFERILSSDHRELDESFVLSLIEMIGQQQETKNHQQLLELMASERTSDVSAESSHQGLCGRASPFWSFFP
jgi:hypothetical protein